jgi:TetR/AcrR family transcriptional repressor of nem operon
MGRTIEFNRTKARDKALLMFWRKGYQATSIADLLETMEISRSSFYLAFVDKRTLFLECLDLFARRTQDVVSRARAEMLPIDALQSFFNFIGPRKNKASWGCMLVNTVLEMSDVDDELSSRASIHLDGIQIIFKNCLQDANCTTARASEFAALLMLVNEGVRVSSRRKLSPQYQITSIETIFRLIRGALHEP